MFKEALFLIMQKIIKRINIVKEIQEFLQKSCHSCNAQDFILTKTDLIEVLEDLAVESGTKIEVLSSSSEEGKMLLSFGGLGAILRYNIR